MRGFGNLMFPSWFILLGGSFVFLDVGPPILFLAFPPFLGCFGLFMIWQGFVNTLVYQLKHKLYYLPKFVLLPFAHAKNRDKKFWQ